MGENPAPHHVVERLTWEKKLGCFSNGNGRIIAHGGDKMKIQGNALARNVTLAIVTFSMICAIGVHAQTYKVLHTFDYTDGSQPITPLVFDPQGNLYGTTFSGGLSGRGTVFKLSPNAVSYTHLRAHETVLDLVCRLLLEKKKKKNKNK